VNNMDEAQIFKYVIERLESGELSESEYEQLTRVADHIVKQWLQAELFYG